MFGSAADYRSRSGAKARSPWRSSVSYLEVEPPSRLVWTNEESDDGAVTTVTFEDKDGKTLLVMHEVYPTKAALDRAVEGMEGGMAETFAQLDELLVTLSASAGQRASADSATHSTSGLVAMATHFEVELNRAIKERSKFIGPRFLEFPDAS